MFFVLFKRFVYVAHTDCFLVIIVCWYCFKGLLGRGQSNGFPCYLHTQLSCFDNWLCLLYIHSHKVARISFTKFVIQDYMTRAPWIILKCLPFQGLASNNAVRHITVLGKGAVQISYLGGIHTTI